MPSPIWRWWTLLGSGYMAVGPARAPRIVILLDNSHQRFASDSEQSYQLFGGVGTVGCQKKNRTDFLTELCIQRLNHPCPGATLFALSTVSSLYP
ncbi:hypothetical protein BKA59DRAFT_1775 [Fusarium tricinctum]|uniref:Secreted protein n=1 Tax=Fusarium tricinctum TaxID=61284 RepID=A0A8K0WG56_9HYPO|nr:hypothetical protein BKA59DRAFT_1775 [Fusarium tricinctum]